MKKIIPSLVLILALTGCMKNSTTSTPNPPQVTLSQLVKTLADSDSAAQKTTATLRANGKISKADSDKIEQWIINIAAINDKVGAELVSGDAWAVQKSKILLLLPQQTIPLAVSDATLAAGLQSILNLTNQIITGAKN